MEISGPNSLKVTQLNQDQRIHGLCLCLATTKNYLFIFDDILVTVCCMFGRTFRRKLDWGSDMGIVVGMGGTPPEPIIGT